MLVSLFDVLSFSYLLLAKLYQVKLYGVRFVQCEDS